MPDATKQPHGQPGFIELSLSGNALTVLEDRYLSRNDDGHPRRRKSKSIGTVCDWRSNWPCGSSTTSWR